ncbi:Exodeoxyribonuclease VII large subunit [hydrothermal vent metagenome]|uniref:Exodeoxyribonuclease VII large subunit n=1 Tax=hydrothermal vent metagenome TaxID=652676 RepID=A0A3B0VKF3_9ZZZZ
MSKVGKTAQNPLTPSALNQMLKKHLADEFGSFWLTGEIFELYQSPAGHSYFTLKDQKSSIKCVLFKQKQATVLRKDMQVTLLGQMTLYTVKGDIQVNVLRLIESGQGNLAQQFEILKHKLQQAGLFASSRKKQLPKLINSLGIITSANGAALQDILNVLLRNNPLVRVQVYPTPVQGNEAAPQINHALRTADEGRHDVLLLTRGGGSKEDLWAFNDEFLAHQLAQLNTPLISAVGHETDESISDLVADMSCITPTAAAHFISGDFDQLKQKLTHNSRLLSLMMQDKFRIYQQNIDSQIHQLELKHPANKLNQQKQTLNNQVQSLYQEFKNNWHNVTSNYQRLEQAFNNQLPNTKDQQQQLKELLQQITWQIQQTVGKTRQELSLAANNLNHQNPLAVLSRGFSLTTKLDNGSVISDVSQVKSGDIVATQLKSGRIHAKIFERFDD